MATRTITDHEKAGVVELATSEWNRSPGGWLGYVIQDVAQTGINAEVDLTGLSVTVDVPANRLLRITASVPFLSTAADDRLTMNIREGATLLGSAQMTSGVANVPYVLNAVALVVTPSAGSHTYKLAAGLGAGSTGAMSSDYASDRVGFILVEDIGAST